MKAEELKIGNWVYICDCETLERVESITPPTIGTDHSDDLLLGDNIAPIEITREILKMNRWQVGEQYAYLELDNGHYYEYYFHEHRLIRWWKGVDEWENHQEVKDVVSKCHPFYVHELQQAFKSDKVDKDIDLRW